MNQMATVSQPKPTEKATRKSDEGWLHIRLKADERRRLKIRAAELDITMADAVRFAIQGWLGKAA